MSNSKMSNISKDNRQTGVEYRYNLDKTENPKYVDLLDEDKPIAGQKFCCVSFVFLFVIYENKLPCIVCIV